MYNVQTAGVSRTEEFSAGLRAHMLSVYNYMSGGLALSGLVAALVAWTSLNGLFYTHVGKSMGFTALGWIAMLAPLGMLLVAMFRSPATWTVGGTQAFYWAFTALQGVGLSAFFQAYSSGSIVRAFFVTAAAFAGLSLYGYTTKRDLTGIGTFCMMGLIGLIVASLIGLFFGGLPQTLFSLVGVLLFAGLTAYDTQAIKENFAERMSTEDSTKIAVWGALDLYLDAMALFKFVLQLTGDRD